MGARHVGYGAKPSHYDAVGESLLAVLGEIAGEAWTPEVSQAWADAYGAIKTIMLAGAKRVNHTQGEKAMSKAPAKKKGSEQADMSGFYLGALEQSQNNILLCDRNLVITYANSTAQKTLVTPEAEIKKVLPKFNAAAIIGVCIDDFHVDPSKQRRILSNPPNMPHRADNQIGPLTLSLLVTAIMSHGRVLGKCARMGRCHRDAKTRDGNVPAQGVPGQRAIKRACVRPQLYDRVNKIQFLMKYSYIIIASLFIIISCNNHRVENVEVNIKVKNENQCKVIIPDKGCSFAQAFDTKKYEEIIGNKDFNQLVFRVLKIVNFKENFSLKATNVHLAAALITNENGVKRRMIIYNPNLFYKENLRKGRFVINTIVAHEVAHHLLGHTLTEEGSRPSIELKADRFAGFVSYALGST